MGARGFPPKPTALRILEGNPSRKPFNVKEPKPKVLQNLEPPEEFTDLQKKIWNSITTEMVRIGLVTEIDYYVVHRYCVFAAEFIETSRRITPENSVIPHRGEDGKIRYITYNPLISMRNEASRQMGRLEQSLGISPSARSRIVIGLRDRLENGIDEDEDPYGE